jgi:O-antigen ligase
MLYKTGYYNYFGNVHAIYDSHPALSIDINVTWRILLWFRYIVERFPENIIGIGFGTPMLDYIAERRSHWTGNDEIHAHVSGAHNSYLTLLLRLGVIGFYAIVMISRKVFKDYFHARKLDKFKQYIPYYFVWIGMFSLIVFNLGLESPLRAGLFWVATGFVAKIGTKF